MYKRQHCDDELFLDPDIAGPYSGQRLHEMMGRAARLFLQGLLAEFESRGCSRQAGRVFFYGLAMDLISRDRLVELERRKIEGAVDLQGREISKFF